ncbi:MAG: tRNA 2-thiocytidine(32) synthetase TtcA [candidate division Zixibacteria bacterium]|nr:tRNA 2-thiocytidine(32) synthetase TtcA [candidate division Zixibacteria bacterium]
MAYFYKSKLEKDLASKVVKASDEFNLIEDGDKIAVAFSGGKDSYTLLRMLSLIKIRGNRRFDLTAVNIDAGFGGYDTDSIKEYFYENKIPHEMIFYPIKKISGKLLKKNEKLCSFCSRIKRGVIYDYCLKEGFNKVALGHNADDVLETLLINQMFAGALRSMPPKLAADGKPITVIRPLYYIFEDETKRYADEMNFPLVESECPESEKDELKRNIIKKLLNELEKDNDRVKNCLLASAGNIHARFLADPRFNKYLDNGKR